MPSEDSRSGFVATTRCGGSDHSFPRISDLQTPFHGATSMAIVATLTYRYLPSPVDPVGYEAVFKVADPVNGGAGQVFATVLQILPENATYWTLDAATSAIQLDPNANPPIRTPSTAYDPDGITAGWTGHISNNVAANAQTVFSLRGKFNA